MSYELIGELILKTETVQRTEKFKVREFVIKVSEQVKDKTIFNYIKLQASNERSEVLNNISIGETLKVNFNIRGNKYDKDGKTLYFTSLDAWKIEVIGKSKFIEEAEVVNESPADDFPF